VSVVRRVQLVDQSTSPLTYELADMGAAGVVVCLQATKAGSVVLEEDFTSGQWLNLLTVDCKAAAAGSIVHCGLALTRDRLRVTFNGAGTYTGSLVFLSEPVRFGVVPWRYSSGSTVAGGTSTIGNNVWPGYAVTESCLAVNGDRAFSVRHGVQPRSQMTNGYSDWTSIVAAAGGNVVTPWVPHQYTHNHVLRNDDAVNQVNWEYVAWGRIG